MAVKPDSLRQLEEHFLSQCQPPSDEIGLAFGLRSWPQRPQKARLAAVRPAKQRRR